MPYLMSIDTLLEHSKAEGGVKIGNVLPTTPKGQLGLIPRILSDQENPWKLVIWDPRRGILFLRETPSRLEGIHLDQLTADTEYVIEALLTIGIISNKAQYASKEWYEEGVTAAIYHL